MNSSPGKQAEVQKSPSSARVEELIEIEQVKAMALAADLQVTLEKQNELFRRMKAGRDRGDGSSVH